MTFPPQAAPLRGAGALPDIVLRPIVPVNVGQMLAARVVAASEGTLELAVAGTRITAQSDLPLAAGDTVRLAVAEAGPETVRLRVVPDLPTAASPATTAAASAAADEAVRPEGMPASTARAVMTTLAQLGASAGADPAARSALLARAQAAGVQTPAQGAAFARLLTAGLPTTPAAVQGLAALTEGPMLGQSLALIGGSASPVTSTTPGAPTSVAGGTVPVPTGPVPAGPPSTPPPASVSPGTAATAVGEPPAAPGPGTAAPAPSAAAPSATPTTPPAAPQTLSSSHAAPSATPANPAAAAAPALPGTALADLVRQVASDAVSGDAERVRQAVTTLGHGTEAHLRAGTAPPADTVRGALLQMATDTVTARHTALAADRTADALAAQNLAGPALAPQIDPSQQGAYMQMPLPGGQTAEVRVMPDEGRGGDDGRSGGGTTRVAFLLHMSALGPVMVEATVGPAGVDAVVKAQSPSVRTFLESQASELAEGLARVRPDGARTRVSVDRLTPPPPRLLPGPPASGLDVAA